MARSIERLTLILSVGAFAIGCDAGSASGPPKMGGMNEDPAHAGDPPAVSGDPGSTTGDPTTGMTGTPPGGGSTGNTTPIASCEGAGIDTTTYDQSDSVAPSQSPPGGLAAAEVPMFVTLGWDDNAYSGLEGSNGTGGLTWAVDMLAARQHMDGSPVKNTFYYTSTYIGDWISESPTYVKRAWNRAMNEGHEVGLHTHNHAHGSAFSLAQWDQENDLTIDWLTKPFDPNEPNTSPDASAGLGASRSDIFGFRTPFLEYNDEALASARGHQLWYDTSIEEGYQYDQDGTNYNWPFTLDNGSPGHDILVEWGQKDPIGNHPGLWEMPVYPVIAPPDSVADQYGFAPGLRDRLKAVNDWFDTDGGKITGFDYNLWVTFKMNKEDFLATLKYSFDLRHEGNRAPFMLGTHTDYYSDKYTAPENSTVRERQEAIEEFLDYVLEKSDVRVASVKEILDWVRDPRPLSCM